MDAAYISALFGLSGAIVGGLTSFLTTWLTQRTQTKDRRREAAWMKRHDLFSQFISEASRVYADALAHQKDDVAELVVLYSLLARLRLLASRPVVTHGQQVMEAIVATYLAPNRSLHELQAIVRNGNADLLSQFAEACRLELALGVSH